MGHELKHPQLPLVLKENTILSPEGIVGYVDYQPEYIYVCFYGQRLIVTENNSFDSTLTKLVTAKINDYYYYAFKIVCCGGATAIVKWVNNDIILVGVTLGYYANGKRIWTNASDITDWPGVREE